MTTSLRNADGDPVFPRPMGAPPVERHIVTEISGPVCEQCFAGNVRTPAVVAIDCPAIRFRGFRCLPCANEVYKALVGKHSFGVSSLKSQTRANITPARPFSVVRADDENRRDNEEWLVDHQAGAR